MSGESPNERPIRVAGVDEVGRGPLAGPVVVAAVVFEDDQKISHFKDSKTLSENKREKLTEQILLEARDWALVALGPRTIDAINILQATRKAMSQVLTLITANSAMIDGNMSIETFMPYRSIIKGDLLHPEIGAASILAKVWRDRLMKSYDKLFPGYHFESHKGYPSKTHREALQTLGASPVHRYTYRTVAELGTRVEQSLLHEDGDDLFLSATKGDYECLPIPCFSASAGSREMGRGSRNIDLTTKRVPDLRP